MHFNILLPSSNIVSELAALTDIAIDMDALGYQYIVYNKLDQPIMTQDSVQRASGEWLFTKYDAFGRTAYTGKATDGRGRHLVQAEVDTLAVPLWVSPSGTANVIGGADIYYGNGGYPNGTSVPIISEVLTINYYDDYDFLSSEPGMALPITVFGRSIKIMTIRTR